MGVKSVNYARKDESIGDYGGYSWVVAHKKSGLRDEE